MSLILLQYRHLMMGETFGASTVNQSLAGTDESHSPDAKLSKKLES